MTREDLKNKKRIVIKVGSSSITHENGDLNLSRIERLVRVLCDLRSQGKDVVLVSSGAIACGRRALHIGRRPETIAEKQAFAAVGQARLMMVYQRLFSEYNTVASQILLTKNIMMEKRSRQNARNTFLELFELDCIPIVNENDTISTHELEEVESFGDNDQLASTVGALINADLVILLSDIEGLYTDNPKTNPDAKLIQYVTKIDSSLMEMGKSESGSNVGTGGMSAKLVAAQIAMDAGADLVIAKFEDGIVTKILQGEPTGTYFTSGKESV
ncbi:glutamate 5-kinase [uncultured Faecalicoccus sp.]|uniref:glutamate 5-kinase n=1 Tax=uncultured Faecalicoccus sp. TaxID=1971760 RepID=UPI002639F385|nr:glutamate 5-kinase [uncultured Faecalicoccus sp.]